MLTTTLLAIACSLAPPPDYETTVLLEGESVLVVAETGEIVGVRQGQSDARCKANLVYETIDGVPIIVDLRCDYLPTCKVRNCNRKSKPSNLPGITEMWCECARP